MTQLAQLPGGITMEITDEHGHIQCHWFAYRWYEQEMLEYIAHTYAGGTFVDVGASVGNHTVYFAMNCSPDTIYAFEPVLESFDHLWRNVLLNDLQGYDGIDGLGMRLYNMALGDRACRGEMVLPDGGNEGMHRFRKSLTGVINMQPLDKFELEDVTLIKIDADGSEFSVVLGAIETIKRCRPVIFIEPDGYLPDVMDILKPMGYRVANQFNATPTYELMCG